MSAEARWWAASSPSPPTTSRGNRPSYTAAAPPEDANALYESFCDLLAGHGVAVERGVFAAQMAVRLVNDGPVTIWLESPQG